MKKKLITVGLCIALMIGMVSATEELGNVDMDFCQGGNRLEKTLDTGVVQSDICMMFINLAPYPLTIDIGIVDGEFAQGGKPAQACKTSANGVFGQSIVISGENRITLPPREQTEKHATYTLLTGFAGVVHGCITYTITSTPGGEQWTMSIVDRKANLIDIIVPGTIQSKFSLVPLSAVISSPDVLLTYGKKVAGDEMIQVSDSRKEKTMTVLMGFENSGYVDEEYTVEIIRSWLFGIFKERIEALASSLYPQEKILYQQSMSNVRWYEWWTSISIVLKHRPKAYGDLQAQERETLNYNLGYLVTPWYLLVIIGVGIIGLILLTKRFIRKRKRGQ